MTSRTISFTEASAALSCQAKHAFGYTGRLTDGERLSPRDLAPVTSIGRAWGAAMAAYHAEADLLAPWAAHSYALKSLNADAEEMRAAGVPYGRDELQAVTERCVALLDDYIREVPPLGTLTRAEDPIDVPLLARLDSGRSSSRYRFAGYVDGWVEAMGGHFLVEFKLRNQLEPEWRVEMNRQIRWYAWALRQQRGLHPLGVIYDQRLNEVPKAPRILKNGDVSHDVRQLTTKKLYIEVCVERGTPPNWETADALDQRQWQKRSTILFRPSELDEAGRELASVGNLIGQLYRGDLTPVRNAGTQCSWCDFRQICLNPRDQPLVDSLFTRKEPKQ